MALFARFLGRTASEGAAYAFGVATGPVLAPATEAIRQEAWEHYRTRIPGVADLAAGVAQGQVDEAQARTWAHRQGFSDDVFSALVSIANVGPDVGTAMQAWRRGALSEAEFRTVLRRHAIEPAWADAIEALKRELLDPAQLAAAIHRGLIPDPGLLKGEQPSGARKVEQYPVYPVDALEEAAGAGFDRDRLGVLVGLQGLPMGPHEAAQALFRGIITHGDYIAAFNQSNNRNEWAAAVLEQSRQIPTARDFFENALRGYHDFEWALGQAKRHGMSEDDATIIYQNAGRPMNLHAITQGLARGGTFKPEPGELRDPYMASIVEGNLKPAYYDLAFAARYQYPSAFAIRGLTQAGTLNEAETKDVLLKLGWEPDFSAKVARSWSRTKSTAAKEATAADELTLYSGGRIDRAEVTRRLQALGYDAEDAAKKVNVVQARIVASATTTAIGGLHTAYKKRLIDDARAVASLGDLGLEDWAVAGVVAAWKVERDAIPRPPTTASVKADYKAGTLSRVDAVIRLERLGMTATEANTFLDAP